MKPVIHARLSAKRHGGEIDDYIAIHEFLDSSKAAMPDMRHRAILHNAFGIYVAQEKFGTHFYNSENKLVVTRDIGEEHVLEDMGRIPTLEDYLEGMPMYSWLGGTKKTKQIWTVEEVD